MKVWLAFAATVICVLGFGRVAGAQPVLAQPPETPITPAAVQELQTNQIGFIPPMETGANALPENQPFKWGEITLRPHLSYRVLYGDGIQSTPGQQKTTVVQEISPGLLFELGRHWTLDYTPTWRLYSSDQFRDGLDHNVILTGGTAYEDWILGVSQSYAATSAPLIETGTQTDQEIYATALTASYRFNSKMSVDLAVNQNFLLAQQFNSSREWSTMDYFNYQFWPRLDVAVGAGFGYVAVSTGPNMTYEQYQGRISWRATDKVSLQVHGGLEDRQFLSGGAPDLINPVFGASVQYQPFVNTTLSLNASRAVTASYFQSQVTENTSLTLNLNQRLFKKLNLNLSGGYNMTTYISSLTGAEAGRTDNNYSFNARLSIPFLKRGTAAVFYQYNDNSSSAPGFAFSSSQIGLEVGFRY